MTNTYMFSKDESEYWIDRIKKTEVLKSLKKVDDEANSDGGYLIDNNDVFKELENEMVKTIDDSRMTDKTKKVYTVDNSQFIDGQPPLISGHEVGTVCWGCEKCFVLNPKFIGYSERFNKQDKQEVFND